LEKQERKPKGQSRQLGETGEKAEGAIKNKQHRETGSITYTILICMYM
jgi:hypothetical protein